MEPGAARPCRARLTIAARDLVRGDVVVDPTGERVVSEVGRVDLLVQYLGGASVAVWFKASDGSDRGSFTRYPADLMVEVLAR